MSLLFPNKSNHRGMCEQQPVGSTPQRAILLVNTGTPDRPDIAAVRKYLAEFLSDPMVIQLPRGLRWFGGPLGRLIARLRAAHSAELYQKIWTERGSPLTAIMGDQAAALASVLPEGWRVWVGMRYGRPAIGDALRDIASAGIEELVVVPMYPQFSRTTTGTALRETYRALRAAAPHLRVATRTSWYDDAAYVHAQARLVAEYASRHGLTPANCLLVFSAHGLPVSYVRRGDPYARHVERSVELVAQRLGWPAERRTLAYQSRLGPAEWLKPDLKEVLSQLRDNGEKRALVCPISFSVDCLETLEEIDIRLRAEFESGGGELHLCPALNDHKAFIGALKNLVLRGPQPASPRGIAQRPLLADDPSEQPADCDLKSLVMIGASLASRVGVGRGPQVEYTEPATFTSIKKPHDDVLSILRSVSSQGISREALIWNTCHRFEFYGWLEKPPNGHCAVARMRSHLFDGESAGLEVNVLFGKEAWHHLVRTTAGLNSGLPGDSDVAEQLQTAYRVAEGAGTAGPRLKCLLDEAVTLARTVREETEWKRHSRGYCLATISRVCETAGLGMAGRRHLAIGGSTTSCSVLHTLREHFGVNARQMTLVHRSRRTGQIKRLRKAVGSGRRVRVHTYTERAVTDSIAQADVVYFGIDSEGPVLRADDLRGVRDFAKRPLMVIDFNSFGSTVGLETIDGVTVWNAARLEREVAAFAETVCARTGFATALAEVERWIAQRTPPAVLPALDLPCTDQGQAVPPRCTGCRTGLHSEPVGSTAR
jgi:ferrochelatase